MDYIFYLLVWILGHFALRLPARPKVKLWVKPGSDSAILNHITQELALILPLS